jgi:hypothetical protein
MRTGSIVAAVIAVAAVFTAGCERQANWPLLVRLDCRFGDDLRLPVTVNLGELRGIVSTSSDSGISVPLTADNGELKLDLGTGSNIPFVLWLRQDGSAKARLKRGASGPVTDIEGACERL